MKIDDNIGIVIKNISKPNDRGNINFDIQVHGEWIRILDCPSNRDNDTKKRQHINDERLENIRETIFERENTIDNMLSLNYNDYILANNLREERKQDFKKRGIKAW